MASGSGATLSIGIFIGLIAGYLLHQPLQQLFTFGQKAGLGAVGHASGCGCGNH